MESSVTSPPTPKSRLVAASYRFIGTFFSLGCAYALMLLVMSFNVYVFFAAILGLAAGEAALGSYRVEARASHGVEGAEKEVVVIKGECGC